MLDVRRMRVLQEVVARGSFSAAAESLHLSQSAVSQQVAVLEREHGDAVMCRLEEAERELAQIAGLEGGRLRLASFPTASATLMTRALSIFRQRFPKVELEFIDVESELIYEEPMYVALPPGHPLAGAKSVRIEDLSDEDWLCGALPSSCRFQVINLCR